MSWGHKITFSVYVQGEPDSATVCGAIALDEAIPCARFIGAAVEPVEHEPKDQVGS